MATGQTCALPPNTQRNARGVSVRVTSIQPVEGGLVTVVDAQHRRTLPIRRVAGGATSCTATATVTHHDRHTLAWLLPSRSCAHAAVLSCQPKQLSIQALLLHTDNQRPHTSDNQLMPSLCDVSLDDALMMRRARHLLATAPQ
jgi:hypothetical protein